MADCARARYSRGRNGGGARFEPGQVVHEIVDRLERVRGGVAQQRVEAPLGLAGKQRDADVERLLQVRLASPAASRGSRRRGTRRSRPGCRPREAAARCRARAETGSTARRPARPGRSRRFCGTLVDDLIRTDARVGLVERRDRRSRRRARAPRRSAQSGGEAVNARRASSTGSPSAAIGSRSRRRRSATA